MVGHARPAGPPRDEAAGWTPAGRARGGAHAARDRTKHHRDDDTRGDEIDLYCRHHRDLERAVARVVNAPRELIEDACQTAWAILLRSQPDRYAVFAWLRVVAIHEAYRLSASERRDARLERLATDDGDWDEVTADPHSLDRLLEAREALRVLASLPERQRNDLALLVAGYSYHEIAEITGGRTRTNVNKSLVKARARIRLARLRRVPHKPTSR